MGRVGDHLDCGSATEVAEGSCCGLAALEGRVSGIAGDLGEDLLEADGNGIGLACCFSCSSSGGGSTD